MMIPAAITLPIVFVLVGLYSLAEGFCSDSGEAEACRARVLRKVTVLKVVASGLVVLLMVGAVIGLYVAWATQPSSDGPSSGEPSMLDAPLNRRAKTVLLLGLLSCAFAFVGRGIGGTWAYFVAVPSLVLGPLALVNAWRARHAVHEHGGTPGDHLVNRVGATAAVIAVVVALACIF